MTVKIDILSNQFTQKYIDVLSELKGRGPRSYGFEYEFLPLQVLTLPDIQAVYRLLLEIGFFSSGDEFQSANGLSVAFEPGGQIEFCSPPLVKDDYEKFDAILDLIHKTNTEI